MHSYLLCARLWLFIYLIRKKGSLKTWSKQLVKWYKPENLMNTALLHVICRLSQNYELQIVQKLPKKMLQRILKVIKPLLFLCVSLYILGVFLHIKYNYAHWMNHEEGCFMPRWERYISIFVTLPCTRGVCRWLFEMQWQGYIQSQIHPWLKTELIVVTSVYSRHASVGFIYCSEYI